MLATAPTTTRSPESLSTRWLIDILDRGDRVVTTRVVYSADYAKVVNDATRILVTRYPEAVDYHIYTEDL